MVVFEIVTGVISTGASLVVIVRAMIDIHTAIHNKRK